MALADTVFIAGVILALPFGFYLGWKLGQLIRGCAAYIVGVLMVGGLFVATWIISGVDPLTMALNADPLTWLACVVLAAVLVIVAWRV